MPTSRQILDELSPLAHRITIERNRLQGLAFIAEVVTGFGRTGKVYEAVLAEGVKVRPLATCLAMAPRLIITGSELGELFARLRRAPSRTLHQTDA